MPSQTSRVADIAGSCLFARMQGENRREYHAAVAGALAPALAWLGERSLPAILLLAAALRICWLALCPNEPVSDQQVYHDAAVSIARGAGFVDALGQPHGWWPVGYSALLAPVYWLLGEGAWVGHLSNVPLGVASVWGLHRLADALAGRRAANAAALLLAVHPTSIMMTTVHALENLYVPIMLWALVVLVRFGGRGGDGRGAAWRAALGTGLLLGLGAYVRAPSLTLLVLVPLWLIANGMRFWRSLAPTAGAVLVALLVLVPWGMRTEREFGMFRLVSMNGMSNLWMGNHPGSQGGWTELAPEDTKMWVPDREKKLGAIAVAFIRENPGEYLKLCAKRVAMTLRSDTIAPTWNERGLAARGWSSLAAPLKALCTAVYYAVAAGALWSLWRRRRALDRVDLLLVATLLVLAFPFVAIVGGNRYHLPLAPLLMVLAARGLVTTSTMAPAAGHDRE